MYFILHIYIITNLLCYFWIKLKSLIFLTIQKEMELDVHAKTSLSWGFGSHTKIHRRDSSRTPRLTKVTVVKKKWQRCSTLRSRKIMVVPNGAGRSFACMDGSMAFVGFWESVHSGAELARNGAISVSLFVLWAHKTNMLGVCLVLETTPYVLLPLDRFIRRNRANCRYQEQWSKVVYSINYSAGR